MDLMPQETSLMLRGRHQACLWPGQKPFRQSCLRCCWSSIFETLYHDNLRAALHVHAGTGDVYLFEGHMRIWRESSDSAIFLFPVLVYWMFTCLFFFFSLSLRCMLVHISLFSSFCLQVLSSWHHSKSHARQGRRNCLAPRSSLKPKPVPADRELFRAATGRRYGMRDLEDGAELPEHQD